jgi:hypothetical protein
MPVMPTSSQATTACQTRLIFRLTDVSGQHAVTGSPRTDSTTGQEMPGRCVAEARPAAPAASPTRAAPEAGTWRSVAGAVTQAASCHGAYANWPRPSSEHTINR